jgi:hypothetical protein
MKKIFFVEKGGRHETFGAAQKKIVTIESNFDFDFRVLRLLLCTLSHSRTYHTKNCSLLA